MNLNMRLLVVILPAILLSTNLANAALFTGEAFDNATVQPGGPRAGGSGKNFFNVEGSNNGNFSSYGVADFLFAAPTTPQTAVTSFSLALTESNAAFTNAGSLVFSLDTSALLADIQPGTSPLAFAPPDPGTGQDVADGDLTLLSLSKLGGGTFTFDTTGNVNSGQVDTYNFDVTPAVQSALLQRINAGETIRLVVGTGDATVAATWAGFSNSTFEGPTLTINTVPEPSSVSLCVLTAAALLSRRPRSVT